MSKKVHQATIIKESNLPEMKSSNLLNSNGNIIQMVGGLTEQIINYKSIKQQTKVYEAKLKCETTQKKYELGITKERVKADIRANDNKTRAELQKIEQNGKAILEKLNNDMKVATLEFKKDIMLLAGNHKQEMRRLDMVEKDIESINHNITNLISQLKDLPIESQSSSFELIKQMLDLKSNLTRK